MFEGMQRGLSEALKKLRGRGRITESNIRDSMAEVRRAMIDADVNFDVVNDFIERVTKRSIGQEVLRTIDPSEQIYQIVYEELVALMGGPGEHGFRFAKDRPTVLMLCGLQGQGKTTTAGKLAVLLKSMNRKPLLVAADLQRPAAIEQLKVLGAQVNVPVFSEYPGNPVDVCKKAVDYAKKTLLDTIILDTAGRLHVAEMPMDELRQIDKQAKPDQIFFVCDAMTGQDAVTSAKAFHDALDINGVILTKLDGDARGGAAISIKAVTGVPVRWVGVGEKLDALEPFRPEGIAQRILGQGDIMSLIDKVRKAQLEVSEEELKKQQEALQKGNLSLEQFRQQFEQVAKMGKMGDILKMLPGGLGDMIPEGEDPEQGMKRLKGMIDAMTKEEKRNPDVIDISRRRRIAAGSGTQPHEVKQFLNHFEQVRDLMKKMANMSILDRLKMMTGLGQAGAFMPGSKMLKTKGDTGTRKSPKQRAEERKKKKKKR